jgi:hypothetical protein
MDEKILGRETAGTRMATALDVTGAIKKTATEAAMTPVIRV